MEVVADTVGSIGVLIAGIVTVTTHWPYADVVVAVLVALWVLPRAIGLARAALRILSSPPASHRRRGVAFRAGRGRRRHRVHDLHVGPWYRAHGHRAPDQLREFRPGARRRARGAGRPRSGPRDRPGRTARLCGRLPGSDRLVSGQLRPSSTRAAGSQSSSRSRHRANSSVSPMVSAARARAATQRRNPGWVRGGTGPGRTLPSVATQLIEAPVVAGAGVGVGGDRLVLGQRLLGQRRHATDDAGWAAATMAGFSPASSSASASLSPGSSTGSGPRRSPNEVMCPLCRCRRITVWPPAPNPERDSSRRPAAHRRSR